MCHSDDSRPPGPPDPGEVADHGPVQLNAADGNEFTAYAAVPARPTGRNVILLPDVRGLHPFYVDLSQRFAEAGFATIAIDYFGRSAGPGDRSDDFDWQSHFGQVTPDGVRTDTAAALDRLRTGGQDGPTYTVGFCYGGSQSWRLAASDLDLAGVIGFYGMPKLVNDVVPDFNKPALMLVAGADEATPLAEFEAMDARLTELDKPHEMHVYDGAPHSFFDRSYARWRPATEDAWRRILAFTR